MTRTTKQNKKSVKSNSTRSIEIVPDSSGGGNTQNPSGSPPPLTNKKQISGRKNHFFTFNNYNSSNIEELLQVFNKYCKLYVFQEETGESGTRHLQGVISCHNKMRDTEFKLPKEIHWESVIDLDSACKYCCKEETRTGKVYTKGYTIPYRFKLETLRPWQQKLSDYLLNTEPDDRTIFWIYESTGNIGKSKFCKHMVCNHNATVADKGKYADIINLVFNIDMDKTRIMLFDIPRSTGNKVSYNAIEAIKNGLICNTKFETGVKAFASPHIVVFANMEPDCSQLSEDRWNIINLDDPYNWLFTGINSDSIIDVI